MPDADSRGARASIKRAAKRALSRIWPTRTAGVGDDALAHAFELLVRVERDSRVLRTVEPRHRSYGVYERLAVAQGVADLPDLPFAVSGETASFSPALPPTGADIVRLGRGQDILRVRAFYLEARVTLVAHGRLLMPWPRLAVLHRGGEVVERVRGLSDFVIPRPLDRGRGVRHAWLVEELVEGRMISPEEWPRHVPRILEGLAQMWIGAGVETKPFERVLSAQNVRSAIGVVGSEGQLDIDTAALARAVRRLASKGGLVLVGWCHGDPMRPNVLLTPDGRLALIDWEAAGRRPLGWDGSKAIMTLDQPLAAADTIAARMEGLFGSGVLPWHEQLAVGCLLRLARSRGRVLRAEFSGNREYQQHVVESRRRNALLLARLLSPGA